MVENLHIPSDKILVLLMNRAQSLDWRKKTVLSGSSRIWRTSFYGFIQDEILLYYPIVLSNCPDISKRTLRPVFLTFEIAQYLVNKVIKQRREKYAVFSTITSSSEKIAIDLVSNIVKAAVSDIPLNRIGERLFNALELKDERKKLVFREMDDIINDYRNKCIELGVLDFGMAVDIYNRCLMNDEEYFEHLKKRIRHLIVDDIEENVPAVTDFINCLLPHLETCIIGYNDQGGYGDVFGGNHDYVQKNLLDRLPVVSVGISRTCDKSYYEFSEMLFDNMVSGTKAVFESPITIERTQPVALRSEMLESAADCICQLIKEGYRPGEIAVISSYADPVTEYVIGRRLEKAGYSIKNLTRRNRVIDSPFAHALITLACLCHPDFDILPNRDDVKTTVQLLLEIDPVRSSIIAGMICSQKPFMRFPDVESPGLMDRIGYYNVDKYRYITDWIEEYKKGPALPINEFLQKVFMEVLLSVPSNEKDLLDAKNLIDSAATFRGIVSEFEKMHPDKGFIDMVRSGIKASESIFELEEKTDGDSVLISTPVAYLANSLSCKVMILLSISSNNWTPRSIRELSNYHVLSKTWDESELYTEELENLNQIKSLAVLTRSLLKRCSEKLITFESELSANGFENNGILADFIWDTIKI